MFLADDILPAVSDPDRNPLVKSRVVHAGQPVAIAIREAAPIIASVAEPAPTTPSRTAP
jgi:hypothetical protein